MVRIVFDDDGNGTEVPVVDNQTSSIVSPALNDAKNSGITSISTSISGNSTLFYFNFMFLICSNPNFVT